jgi:cephalosporin hydroxylase
MKITIDTDAHTLAINDQTIDLYSKRAFEIISRQWVRVGWDQKYPYTFAWMGRPIIQLPEDMVRIQEVIHAVKPDMIIETGIAHGGSLVFYASLCKAMGKGRVVGVDIEIRPHNRAAIEAHELFEYITLIEGDSVAPEQIAQVEACIRPGDAVLVLLDSCHMKAHVAAELEAYHRFVTPGSYIVATDGIMEDLADVPRGDASWMSDNPSAAAREFVGQHDDFILEQPAWPFNESALTANITHWPSAYLRRR